MSERDTSFVLGDRFEDGLARMREVLGEEATAAVVGDHARARRRGDPDRVAVPVATAWGWLLDRPTLSLRERALALLAVDVARGSERAFRDHVLLALHAGVSERELHELMVQLGPFAGYPSVNDASARLRAILDATRPTLTFEKDATFVRCRLVVRDTHRAATLLSSLLGVGSWAVVRREGVTAVGTTPGGTTFEVVGPEAGGPEGRLRLLAHGPYVESVTLAPTTGKPPGATAEIAGLTFRVPAAPSDPAASTAADASAGEEWTFDRPDELAATHLGDQPLDHIGLVTRDIYATTRDLARLFGAHRWLAVRFGTDDGSLSGATYHGRPGRFAYLSAMGRAGDFRVEACQPVLGAGRYGDGFLDAGCRGAQHLFFGPVRSDGAWHATCAALVATLGLTPVETADAWDGAVHYGYLPTRELIGFDLELARIPPDADLDPTTQASLLLDHRPRSLSADPRNPATDQ